jgi:hypothetical protein
MVFLGREQGGVLFGEIMMEMSTCNSNRWNQKEAELFGKEPAEACERNSGVFLCWQELGSLTTKLSRRWHLEVVMV